jgi:hypothetical protein
MIMAKLDYKKILKPLYKPGNDPERVEVPNLNYLMIDGKGNPNTSPIYSDTVSALYKFAYAIRFFMRDEEGVDFGVMPLEGLWWVEDMNLFSQESKEDWLWTMMILQPEPVTPEIVETVRPLVFAKHKLPQLEEIRFETYSEGRSAQVMHHGPYAAEKPTIDRLHAFIREHNCQPHLKHHEIYLNDPQRTAPEKLLTIIRQPVIEM